MFVKSTYFVDTGYSYNIEFDLNGGISREDYSYGDNINELISEKCDYSARKIYEGSDIEVGVLTKEGYVFIG